MSECAKTHLQQSRISKFSGGGPPDSPLQGEGREGEGKEEREGKDREGRGGTGRDREERRGGMGVGRGGKGRSTWAPPPLETSSGSAPGFVYRTTQNKKKKITKNVKPLSRVSPVQYSPRRQSR